MGNLVTTDGPGVSRCSKPPKFTLLICCVVNIGCFYCVVCVCMGVLALHCMYSVVNGNAVI